MGYVVWRAKAVENACRLEPVENVDDFVDLYRGASFERRFPRDATFRMNKSFKKDTKLVDDVLNGSSVKVCSKRLVEFLRKQKLERVEYLPVTILDHKGKVASSDYSIVNPVGLQDALDLKASGPHYNPIARSTIDWVERIVLDEKRLDPTVRLFRLSGLMTPVLVEQRLAEAIAAEAFVGTSFAPLASVKK